MLSHKEGCAKGAALDPPAHKGRESSIETLHLCGPRKKRGEQDVQNGKVSHPSADEVIHDNTVTKKFGRTPKGAAREGTPNFLQQRLLRDLEHVFREVHCPLWRRSSVEPCQPGD